MNDFPEQHADFLRYAIQLNCINPIRDITKCLLPPLEEIARGVLIQLRTVKKKTHKARLGLRPRVFGYIDRLVSGDTE